MILLKWKLYINNTKPFYFQFQCPQIQSLIVAFLADKKKNVPKKYEVDSLCSVCSVHFRSLLDHLQRISKKIIRKCYFGQFSLHSTHEKKNNWDAYYNVKARVHKIEGPNFCRTGTMVFQMNHNAFRVNCFLDLGWISFV